MSDWFLSRTQLLKYLVTESENHFKRDLTHTELSECFQFAKDNYHKFNSAKNTARRLVSKNYSVREFRMSIEKFSGSFRKEKSGITILHTKTIQAIKCAPSLGIYCYLASKPDDWQINVKELCAHFGKSKDFIYKYLGNLLEIGALVKHVVRASGKFAKFEYELKLTLINIDSTPFTEKPDTEKPFTEKPETYKTKNKQNKEITKTRKVEDKSSTRSPKDLKSKNTKPKSSEKKNKKPKKLHQDIADAWNNIMTTGKSDNGTVPKLAKVKELNKIRTTLITKFINDNDDIEPQDIPSYFTDILDHMKNNYQSTIYNPKSNWRCNFEYVLRHYRKYIIEDELEFNKG